MGTKSEIRCCKTCKYCTERDQLTFSGEVIQFYHCERHGHAVELQFLCNEDEWEPEDE